MITVSTLEGVRLSWVIGQDIIDVERVSDVTSCLSRRKEKFALYISHRTWSAATKLANNTPQASHVRAIRADVGPKRSSGTVVLVHTRARHESTTTPLVYLELTLGRICLKEEDVRTRSQPAVALKRRSGTAQTLQSECCNHITYACTPWHAACLLTTVIWVHPSRLARDKVALKCSNHYVSATNTTY